MPCKLAELRFFELKSHFSAQVLYHVPDVCNLVWQHHHKNPLTSCPADKNKRSTLVFSVIFFLFLQDKHVTISGIVFINMHTVAERYANFLNRHGNRSSLHPFCCLNANLRIAQYHSPSPFAAWFLPKVFGQLLIFYGFHTIINMNPQPI